MAAVALAFLFGISGWYRWNYRDPGYEFQLAGVKDPQQAVDLVRLVAELRGVKEWQPPSQTDAAAEGIADWIREKNPHARTRADLLRGSAQPGFAACNGLVYLLPDLSSKDLVRWREAKRDDVIKEIRTIFNGRAADTREAAYAEILGREKTRALLEAVPIPSYPETPTWSRRTACRLGSKRVPDRERWVGAFIDAVENQLLDRARKYLSISEISACVAGTGEVRFLLKPYRPGGGSPAADLSVGSEVEVWLGLERDDLSSAARQEWDTGVRLTAVEWEWEGGSPAGTRLRTHPVRPAWPPAEPPFILITPFEEFLHRIGLPEGVSVRAKGVRVSGSRESPTFSVECELSSSEFSEWSVPVVFTLPSGSWVRIKDEIAKAAERVRRGLIGHVAGLRELAGFPAEIRETPGGDGDFWVKVRCGDTTVDLHGTVGNDCRVAFYEVPELDSRFRLAESVARAEPRVSGYPVIVRSTTVDRHKSEVVVGGVLAVPTGTAEVSFSVTFRPGEPPRIALAGPVPSRAEGVNPTPVPLRSDGIQAKARSHIEASYPSLAPHLQVVTTGDGTTWLRLGVRISDWPAVELGPVAVTSVDAVPATVDQLLAEDSVRRHAAVQWSLRGRPVRHRRYGPVHSELANWDARNGVARIRCACTAPGFRRLEWIETARIGPGGWSQNRLDELTREIERQLGHLDGGVGVAFVSEKQCVLAAVRPDRDAFGPGRWVRLNPLSIAVAADLHLVHLGVSVTASGVVIDPEGVHLPREVSATYLGTFYTPKFCLSDPTVRIGLEDRSLAVSAKFTPPIGGFQKQPAPKSKLPGGAGPKPFAQSRNGRPREAKGPASEQPPPGHLPAPAESQLLHAFGLSDDDPRLLRLDNLWLHVAYLQMELKGSLTQSLIQARGRLRVRGTTDVAYGELSCTLESLDQIEINGELEAVTPLPGLGAIPARVNGRLHYGSGKGVFECGVRSSVGGHEVAGLRMAVFARPGEQYQLRLHGHAEFPRLAGGEVRGWATLDMADYDLAGELRGAMWLVRFRASPAGAEFSCSRKTPAGLLGVRISLPRVDGTSQAHVEDALARAGPATDEQLKAATPEEERWAEDRFRADPPRPAGGGGSAEVERPQKRDEDPAGGGGYVKVRGVVDVTEAEPRMIRVRDRAREDIVGREVVLFQFPHNRLPIEPGNCRFRYWGSPKASPEVYDILVYDLAAGKIHAIRWDGKGVQLNDLTPHFRGIDLPALSAGAAPPDRLAGRMASAWDTAETYFRKTLEHGKNVRDPVLVAGGLAFSYYPGGGGDHFTVYTWEGSRGICQAEIASPVPDGRRTEPLYNSLRTAFDAENDAVIKVVAVHPADHARFARLVNRDRPVLELPFPSGVRRIPVAGGYEPRPLLTQAAACGNAFFAGHEIAGTRLWLGGRGACVEDGDALWVITDNGAATPSAGRLRRARFDDWPDESARLLPAEWHQRSARAALSWEQVQDKALTDWNMDRLRDGFEAHPLGLLIGLASRP